MMRDTPTGVDAGFPYRPRYHVPARNGNDFFNPRGIRMYWRAKYSDGFVSTSYPEWWDVENIQIGPLTHVGGAVSGGKTLTVHFDIAGRVPPHEYLFTIRKTSATGTVSDTVTSLFISGPGEYSYAISSVTGGSATVLGSGTTYQNNLFDDSALL